MLNKYFNFDIVFYHSPCQDGLASAYVANKYAKENGLDYRFIGLSLNKDDLGISVDNKCLLFLDIVPSDNQLNIIEKYAKKYLILDHHKTNRDKFEQNPNTIFRMDRSGVGLTWEYFYPYIEMPLFLKMIEDRDLWTKSILNSDYFCNGLYHYCFMANNLKESFEYFDELSDPKYGFFKLKELIQLGVILKKKREKQIFAIVKHTINKVYLYDKKYNVAIVNCDNELANDLSEYILKNYPIYHFVVCWRYSHMDESYWLSLRSDGKIDISDIAKKYGGGGHPNSSGFSSFIHPSILFSN